MAFSRRRLLPKQNPEQSDGDRRPQPLLREGKLLQRGKRPVTATACLRCRRKKSKCDGQRPQCSVCAKASEACTYPLQRRRPQNAEGNRDATLLRLLHTLPYDEALELLMALRTNMLPVEVTDAPTLSETKLLRTLLGSTQNSLEFELMTRHPVAYPSLVLLDTTSKALEGLLRSSLISSSRETLDRSLSDRSELRVTIQHFPTRPLVDKRLRSLDIKNWSGVPITNELASRIISFYIEIDYPVLPLFDLDLFLENLVNNLPYFCSRLLVHSLLSWACQSYAAIDSEAHSLGQAFFNEAEQLIADGTELHTLTSVAALQFLNIASLGYGRGRLAVQFLRKCVETGSSIGLFNVGHETESASIWLDDQGYWSKAAAYTAWGVYNWTSLYSLRYHSVLIHIPPKIPMPGTLYTSPETQSLDPATPSVNLQVFQACCELWMISNSVARNNVDSDNDEAPFCHDQSAEEIYRRLLIWADALPLSLVRSKESDHAVLMMHVYFHVIVADLFRHLPSIPHESVYLHSFATPQAAPQAAYAASIQQLKRLLLLFRLSFKTASLSILSQTVLIYVYNAILREMHNSDKLEWRFYLRLCLAASEDLYGSYRQAWSVIHGLLSMALERSAVQPEEARRIVQEMIELSRFHSVWDEEVTNYSMIDLDLAVIDPAAARVGNLAGKFEDLMLNKPVEEFLVDPTSPSAEELLAFGSHLLELNAGKNVLDCTD